MNIFFVLKPLWCRVFVEVEVEIYQGDLALSKLSEDLFLDVFVWAGYIHLQRKVFGNLMGIGIN